MTDRYRPDMGHAALMLEQADMVRRAVRLTPQELRARLLTSIQKNISLFGPAFINVVKGNPKLEITAEEERELREWAEGQNS